LANYNTFQEQTWKTFSQTVTSTAETNLLVSAGGANITLPIPAWKSIFDGRAFCVRCAGWVTTDASSTANLKMYYSATAAGAKTTNIAATGASGSIATTSNNFNLELWLMWDSTSQNINGQQFGWFFPTTVVSGTATTPVTSIADISAGVWFQPTITFSAVTAAATVRVTDFGIDVI